ncbi:fibrobacter succinogenes major paralogous domain-containing protein [Pedobacter arcticus]|uniref:hypothetical protein n=1 Tax=Pedobacter arcticus TaxID=752140 RepID=UPI0002E8A83A|nr:hypothetical protein [Pedobacter arcticus]
MKHSSIYVLASALLFNVACSTKKTATNAVSNIESLPTKEVGSAGTVEAVLNNEKVTYKTVRAADGEIWLQQNLGSLRVAANISDKNAYGNYFQWGRGIDGHEKAEGAVEVGVAKPNNPRGLSKTEKNPFYASEKATGFWWKGGDQYDTWEANENARINEINGCDPCKQLLGRQWRMPTLQEWKSVLVAEKATSFLTAYSSNLKLVPAGMKNANNGKVGSQTSMLRYWAGTAAASGNAFLVYLSNKGLEYPAFSRAGGLPVRCIRAK